MDDNLSLSVRAKIKIFVFQLNASADVLTKNFNKLFDYFCFFIYLSRYLPLKF